MSEVEQRPTLITASYGRLKNVSTATIHCKYSHTCQKHWELVAYERLDQVSLNRVVTAESSHFANADAMFHWCKSQFWFKKMILSIEKFYFLVLSQEYVTAPYSFYYLLSGCLQEVKNKEKFQTFSSKSGCRCFREVVTFQEVQNMVLWRKKRSQALEPSLAHSCRSLSRFL